MLEKEALLTAYRRRGRRRRRARRKTKAMAHNPMPTMLARGLRRGPLMRQSPPPESPEQPPPSDVSPLQPPPSELLDVSPLQASPLPESEVSPLQAPSPLAGIRAVSTTAIVTGRGRRVHHCKSCHLLRSRRRKSPHPCGSRHRRTRAHRAPALEERSHRRTRFRCPLGSHLRHPPPPLPPEPTEQPDVSAATATVTGETVFVPA